MKSVYVCLLLFLFVDRSFASMKVIAHYSFHNQIVGSELSIFSDGSLKIGERSCCPPRVIESSRQLTALELQTLITWIESTASGKLLVFDGNATAEGSQSGELQIFDSKNNEVVVQKVERSSQLGGKDKITVNLAPSSRRIREFIIGLAQVKMPEYNNSSIASPHEASIVAICNFMGEDVVPCRALIHIIKLEPKNGGITYGTASDFLTVSCGDFASENSDNILYDGPLELSLRPGSTGEEKVVDTIFLGRSENKNAVVLVQDFNWTKPIGKYKAQLGTRSTTLNGLCQSY